MNSKKAIIIGLLTITALSVTACAIFLTKYKDEYKPKTLTTYAYQEITDTEIDVQNNIASYELKAHTDSANPDTITIEADVTKQIDYYTFSITLKVSKVDNKSYLQQQQTTKTITTGSNETPKNLILTRTKYIILGTQHPNLTSQYKITINTEEETQYEQTATITAETNRYTTGTNNDTIEITKIELANNNANLKEVYAEGYANNTIQNTPLDIRGLMLNVLTMPFTFINQAFNVTFWEGTPYAFNVSSFIKSMIAIASILFIIRLFTSGFSIIGNYASSHESRSLKRSQTKLNKAKTEKIKKDTK